MRARIIMSASLSLFVFVLLGLPVNSPVVAGEGLSVVGPAPQHFCPPYPPAKTGQTSSYMSGDDGEYRAGVTVNPRFTENGDGTVTDNLTDLIWLKDANCFSWRDWENALSDANTLAEGYCGLTDGSVAGDWRLPNVKEFQSLLDYGQFGPVLPSGHPFSGVMELFYWSSTTHAMRGNFAWRIMLFDGLVDEGIKIITCFVWPVRGPE